MMRHMDAEPDQQLGVRRGGLFPVWRSLTTRHPEPVSNDTGGDCSRVRLYARMTPERGGARFQSVRL